MKAAFSSSAFTMVLFFAASPSFGGLSYCGLYQDRTAVLALNPMRELTFSASKAVTALEQRRQEIESVLAPIVKQRQRSLPPHYTFDSPEFVSSLTKEIEIAMIYGRKKTPLSTQVPDILKLDGFYDVHPDKRRQQFVFDVARIRADTNTALQALAEMEQVIERTNDVNLEGISTKPLTEKLAIAKLISGWAASEIIDRYRKISLLLGRQRTPVAGDLLLVHILTQRPLEDIVSECRAITAAGEFDVYFMGKKMEANLYDYVSVSAMSKAIFARSNIGIESFVNSWKDVRRSFENNTAAYFLMFTSIYSGIPPHALLGNLEKIEKKVLAARRELNLEDLSNDKGLLEITAVQILDESLTRGISVNTVINVYKELARKGYATAPIGKYWDGVYEALAAVLMENFPISS